MAKAARKLPPRAYLRECLIYNRRTGALHWRKRPRSHFASEREWLRWNARYAGHQTGCPLAGEHSHLIVRIRKTNFLAHRVIWRLVTGYDPGPLEIDHINLVRTDNRWHNLRQGTRSNNQWNRVKLEGQPLPKGVRALSATAFRARITVHRIRRELGTFRTAEEAHAAYCAAARRLHGEWWNPG